MKICNSSNVEQFYQESQKKTIPCKYFAKGECNRPDCMYVHDIRELQAKNHKYKTELCSNFMKTGRCRFGESCIYAHGP